MGILSNVTVFDKDDLFCRMADGEDLTPSERAEVDTPCITMPAGGFSALANALFAPPVANDRLFDEKHLAQMDATAKKYGEDLVASSEQLFADYWKPEPEEMIKPMLSPQDAFGVATKRGASPDPVTFGDVTETLTAPFAGLTPAQTPVPGLQTAGLQTGRLGEYMRELFNETSSAADLKAEGRGKDPFARGRNPDDGYRHS